MERKFYTIKELAELLGVSDFWVKRRIKSNQIPSYKMGRKRLFKKEEIEAWIEAQKEGACK